MNDLVSIKNNEVVCSSLDVSEKFKKQHKNVIRDIEKIKEYSSAQKWAQSFHETTYKDAVAKKDASDANRNINAINDGIGQLNQLKDGIANVLKVLEEEEKKLKATPSNPAQESAPTPTKPAA